MHNFATQIILYIIDQINDLPMIIGEPVNSNEIPV